MTTASHRLAIVLLILVTGLSRAGDADRPANWAQPLDLPGLPNCFKVSDALYRSAQPSADGMVAIKGAGVKTVVNLRSFHSDRDELGATGLGYEHIHMKAWHPEEEDVVRFLKIVTDPARTPVLVHCKHGSDRTGTMVALYRIVVQGWTKEAALDEMTHGGYGFHAVWQNLPDWITHLDIERVREKAGLAGDSRKDQ